MDRGSCLAASLLFTGLEVQASVGETFKVDKLNYTVLTETGSTGTVEVVKDNDSWDNYLSGNLDIPASVKHGTITYSVVSIGDEAFQSTSVTGVTIPNSVTRIGDYAFNNCKSLTGITIPNSVTTIGDYAFRECRLVDITIPNSVTTMGAGVFSGCTGLTNVILPNKLTAVSTRMFYNCLNLKNIKIPDAVTMINSYAFWKCEKLTDITLSAGLTQIESSAFSECKNLTKITLPASLKSMGYSVFKDCVRLTEVYYEGDNPSAGLNIYENTLDDLLSYYPTGNATWLERIENGKWRDRGVATWDPEPRPPGPTGDFSYTYKDGVLILYFTGTLCQSADAVHWTELPLAISPYQVALKDKKSFFCAKSGSTPPASKDITIPLASGVDLTLIWIEPGTFMMGSPENEFGRFTDEDLHQVTLTRGYWLGKYEITQAQYEAVMGTNPSTYKGADLPVETVSWYDAKEFCAKLTEIEQAAGRLLEGYEYTLPTEAQWEYACRAGTTTVLNSGKNLSDVEVCSEVAEVGWYWYNCGKTTHSVGQKQPNAWGLYDMHGNVREWCLDWYGDYPASSVTDPTGPSTGSSRVNRGGSWGNIARNCRSAYRNDNYPGFSIYYNGFRVALAPVK